jgi:hypothetical protein
MPHSNIYSASWSDPFIDMRIRQPCTVDTTLFMLDQTLAPFVDTSVVVLLQMQMITR